MIGQREIRQLIKDKKYRHETGLFWVDGVNFVKQALESGLELELGVYVPGKIDSDFKREIVAKFEEGKRLELGESSYAPLSAKDDIQGVGGVFKMKKTVEGVQIGAGVVLENISYPGNLGTIARTCVAFGIENMYVVTPAADPFSFEAIRASMGAMFKLNLIIVDSLTKLQSSKHVNLGMALQNSNSLASFDQKFGSTDNVLFWFGNEAKGLSESARGMCKELLRIPHSSKVDSLNVSESVGITLYSLLKTNNE